MKGYLLNGIVGLTKIEGSEEIMFDKDIDDLLENQMQLNKENQIEIKWKTFCSKLNPEQLMSLAEVAIEVKNKGIGWEAIPLILEQLDEEMKEIYRSC
jgi:hypothetical protein